MHCVPFNIVENYVERRAPFRSEHLTLAKQAYERGDRPFAWNANHLARQRARHSSALISQISVGRWPAT
jgi:hypothetical protein